MFGWCSFLYLSLVLTLLSNSDAFLFHGRYQQKSGHTFASLQKQFSYSNVLHSSGSEIASTSVTSPESDGSIHSPSPHQFDISLAVILAGYSFEAYNEPVTPLNWCRDDFRWVHKHGSENLLFSDVTDHCATVILFDVFGRFQSNNHDDIKLVSSPSNLY